MGVFAEPEPRAGPEAPHGGAPSVGDSVRVHSARFGTMDVPGDRLIHFVRPVVGFQDLDHYAVVEDEETAPVLWLQALAAPEVLLPVVDACLVTGDYGVNLADADVEALELDRADDARLLLVVTLSPDPSAITVNLRAPIVWNTRRATAMQLVLEDPKLPVSHGIGSVGGRRRSNKEVARAGPDAPQG